MKVYFIVGPTASGKSEIALRWAEQTKGVIVNCDSVQMYDHIQIGAAKPTPDELKRVPHFLYGHVKPPHEYTAGEYYHDFFSQLDFLQKQGEENVFVVGGTGFYFQAIEKGMYTFKEEINPELSELLRKRAETSEGLKEMHLQLKQNDAETAEKIHPNDQYRIIRALEIIIGTGKKPSDLKKNRKENPNSFPYPLEKKGVLWERNELELRIQKRVKKMLQGGLIEEVLSLIEKGFQNWAPLSSVGYHEVQQFLNGEIKTKEDLTEQIIISTRQLAKRQMTWFKRDSGIHWQRYEDFKFQ